MLLSSEPQSGAHKKSCPHGCCSSLSIKAATYLCVIVHNPTQAESSFTRATLNPTQGMAMYRMADPQTRHAKAQAQNPKPAASLTHPDSSTAAMARGP